MSVIDLNSDLGEGYGAWATGDDAATLALVTSAKVACGFHAGDPAGIRRTLSAAAKGAVVGAHGDSRGTVEIACELHRTLESEAVTLRSLSAMKEAFV